MYRYHIPKPNKPGQLRPITKPAKRDRLVSVVLTELLNLIMDRGDFKIASVPGNSSLVQLPNRIVRSTACFERTGTLEVSFNLPSKIKACQDLAPKSQLSAQKKVNIILILQSSCGTLVP
jgi:hypothetical protein